MLYDNMHALHVYIAPFQVLPVYLNALAGEGAFVVTTNDYLARRDADNVGQVLRFLGLTVGVVQAQQGEAQRQQAYSCDVTYVSNQVPVLILFLHLILYLPLPPCSNGLNSAEMLFLALLRCGWL